MRTIRDAMTQSVISVRPETPLKEVARLLVDNRISGVPVVDAAGAVLGVVSEADFLTKQLGSEAVTHARFARILGESRATRAQLVKLGAVTAGEAMTAPAVIVAPGRPISEAAAIMHARDVNRLPVVDDGQLVGMITRADLVRAFVQSDAELARTISEDVLLRILWLDPSSFVVEVRDGVASIRGHVERRSIAEMLERAVRMVPGIVDVHADVTWASDDARLEPASVDAVFPFSPR
jgi:CBS domain-containing protein